MRAPPPRGGGAPRISGGRSDGGAAIGSVAPSIGGRMVGPGPVSVRLSSTSRRRGRGARRCTVVVADARERAACPRRRASEGPRFESFTLTVLVAPGAIEKRARPSICPPRRPRRTSLPAHGVVAVAGHFTRTRATAPRIRRTLRAMRHARGQRRRAHGRARAGGGPAGGAAGAGAGAALSLASAATAGAATATTATAGLIRVDGLAARNVSMSSEKRVSSPSPHMIVSTSPSRARTVSASRPARASPSGLAVEVIGALATGSVARRRRRESSSPSPPSRCPRRRRPGACRRCRRPRGVDAVAALEAVGRGIARERVVAAAADHVLHVRGHVVGLHEGDLAVVGHAVRVDAHRCAARPSSRRYRSLAAGHLVGTSSTFERVVACVARERVGVVIAGELVVVVPVQRVPPRPPLSESSPAPPFSVSAPRSPLSGSAPAPPVRVFGSPSPVSVSAPAPPTVAPRRPSRCRSR